ncbi:hypothetical protein AYR55_11700 [Loigolactobacillus backii]|uniref:helix-turn-helix domain-containing protein n=1 Tax=Loigolactobacillus backii TaxID=375175 RepID=UPI0007F11B56|nr:helix-turn-helix transcriptional regulator [Loigolactobacillus backii]ANK68292.1 hypothetical protein AYR55_11700 [Loigolactobacillus backii]
MMSAEKRNKLAGYLREYAITQRQVAKIIGKSYVATSNKINDKTDFTRSEIRILHDALHIPISVFFD